MNNKHSAVFWECDRKKHCYITLFVDNSDFASGIAFYRILYFQRVYSQKFVYKQEQSKILLRGEMLP